mgnify:CR=1 FL=1
MKDNSLRLLELFIYNKGCIKKGSLLEQAAKNSYLKKLNEGHYTELYHNLVEHFSAHNKLTGNLREDVAYLKEFSLLLENDNFDPFAHLVKTDKIDEKNDCVLSISMGGNAKLNHPYFSLPAGNTCPFANVCKSFVKKDRSKFKSSGMKIMDTGDIRCYAASTELIYPNVQNSRWRNFDLLQKFKGDVKGMAELIEKSLEYAGKNFSLFRIHESGDFFSQEYFDAWLEVAKNNPNIKFYTYTKALPYWVARLGQIPPNLKLIASKGGKYDHLIDKYNLRYSQIVTSPEEAKELKLPIDVDDSLAYNSDKNFALLLHGKQPKKSGLNTQAIKNQKLLKKMKGYTN